VGWRCEGALRAGFERSEAPAGCRSDGYGWLVSETFLRRGDYTTK
jgi:hypothetical protein